MKMGISTPAALIFQNFGRIRAVLIAGQIRNAAPPFGMHRALNGKACRSRLQRFCNRQSLPVACKGLDSADRFPQLLPDALQC